METALGLRARSVEVKEAMKMNEAATALLSCMDCGTQWPATGEFMPTDPGHEFYPDDLFVADAPQSCPACGYPAAGLQGGVNP